jgi:propionyl-CoA carboxylase alpha chain
MFDKILVANRGEIAVRIIRTCQRLGIGAVAVYSDADRRSLHVQKAGEAVHIGDAPARASYLDAEKIVAAALASGCQAVHPGYGFLSENAVFARRVAAAGLVFIGPPPEAIALMGDKIASKDLAAQAGVPVIPGHAGELADEAEARAAAEAIGYPVLLKPAAGGGGKGMRIVRRPDDMPAALAASRQETRKAFGDSRIFVERYIEQPRHVEIQIMADTFGQVIHLGERECSIQRRYQKIIEESPSPAVSVELRRRMGQAACDLARQAGYVNAGTVEFVLDARADFYFLEMNTRLQVEHPVTEAVTGLDLVELQIRVAAGERLPLDQENVGPRGWAMEARICAEDPERGFIPSTGMITRYAEPKGNAIRVDSGIQTGSSIGVYYDSLLAKVICHGRDRDDARLRLIEALNGYHIEGVVTNTDFVTSILSHPEFAAGHLTTGFIERQFEGGHSKHPPDERAFKLAALTAALIYHVRMVAVQESLRPMAPRIGGERTAIREHRYFVRAGQDALNVRLEGPAAGRRWTIRIGPHTYTVIPPEFEFYRRRLKLTIDDQVHRFRVRFEQSFIYVAFSGITRVFEIYTPKEWALMPFMPDRAVAPDENVLLCPMPGLVVGVAVKEGERVFRGQTLVILESMKMESDVASPVDGVVAEVLGTEGQAVEAGDVLIRFEA